MDNNLTDAEWLIIWAYRTLGAVVPNKQNDMIDWAIKSKDSVYTRAGAAYYTLGDYIENIDFNFLPITNIVNTK